MLLQIINLKSRIINHASCHRFVAMLVIGLAACSVVAQPPVYPPPATPAASWGGYVVPEQVPYQPTMPVAPEFVEPENVYPPEQLVPVYPGDPNMPYCPPGSESPVILPPGPEMFPQSELRPARKSIIPPGGRNGVFQKIKFTGAYLPRFDSDSIGMSDLKAEVVFGLPLIERETPLVITPFYGIHYFDGPDSPDVPARTHDAAVMLQHFRRLGDSAYILALDMTIGEFADDESFGTSDSLRITGGGAVAYEMSDTFKWVLGVQYVDRANTQFLPVAGFIYTPNDDVEYKLVFPIPRVSWRILPWTNMPGKDERWLYVAGEFGGGAWAVQRTSGATDELDINDWRIYLGLERKIIGGLSRRIEIGYVFARELQYASTPGHVSLDDTIMLRAGMTY